MENRNNTFLKFPQDKEKTINNFEDYNNDSIHSYPKEFNIIYQADDDKYKMLPNKLKFIVIDDGYNYDSDDSDDTDDDTDDDDDDNDSEFNLKVIKDVYEKNNTDFIIMYDFGIYEFNINKENMNELEIVFVHYNAGSHNGCCPINVPFYYEEKLGLWVFKCVDQEYFDYASIYYKYVVLDFSAYLLEDGTLNSA
jgi:hypothetical protein